jgi:hypothetical protein
VCGLVLLVPFVSSINSIISVSLSIVPTIIIACIAPRYRTSTHNAV